MIKYFIFIALFLFHCKSLPAILQKGWILEISQSTYFRWNQEELLLSQSTIGQVQISRIQSFRGEITVSITDAQNRSQIQFLVSDIFMENSSQSTHYFKMPNGNRATLILAQMGDVYYSRWEWIDRKVLVMVEEKLSPYSIKGNSALKTKAHETHNFITEKLNYVSP